MDYSKLVPQDSFLGRYLAYMSSQETSYEYDWWCGLWCIGAACGRYAHVARPRAPVYLNMFVILVGESGIARKTTSVHTAARIVRSIMPRVSDMAMMDAKCTPEALDLQLQEQSEEFGNAQLCIAVPELAVFMGTERYIAHMPTLLTDLYDCPAMRVGGGTIARGSVVQRNVWVHFLSASTPIWLLKTVNPNVIEGGFTSRCYFVVSNEPKQSVAWPTEPDTHLFAEVCEDAQIIANEARTRGPIALTDEAQQSFVSWYSKRTRSIDPFKQSFEAREDAHVLRVAALLCINDGTWCVGLDHLNKSITLVTALKERSGTIFVSAEARSKYAIGLDILRSYLINTGMDPVAHHRLYLKVRRHLDNQEFRALLDVLHEIGAIQRFSLNEAGRGRPTDYVRGTKLLLARGLGDSVMDRFT